MDQQSLIAIAVIIVFILFSAFFSASETAFTSLNKLRLKAQAEAGDARAEQVLALANRFERLISGILIGNNIVNIGSSAVATTLFMQHFPRHGATMATVVMTLVVLIFGEITPKSLANQHPAAVARMTTPLLKAILNILSPLTYVFGKMQTAVLKLFGGRPVVPVSDAELMSLVDEAGKTGNLSEYEQHLITQAIQIDDMKVWDIVTPRVDIVGIDINDSLEEIKETFYSNNFSRLVVYRESLDDILGVLHEKRLSRFLLKIGDERELSQCVSDVLTVPFSMRVTVLLNAMQTNQIHFAVVKDEYGGTLGIITMEDILEVLVGEIWDEGDTPAEEIIPLGRERFQLDGSAPVDKVLALYGEEVPEEVASSSIGGFFIEMAEDSEIQVGQRLIYKGLALTILRMDQRRIVSLRMEPALVTEI